jgi:hypothetical protein
MAVEDALSSNENEWVRRDKSNSFDSVLHESCSGMRVSKGFMSFT